MTTTKPKNATASRTTPHVAEHRRTAEEMAAYLDARFEATPDDAAGIARALGVKLHAEAAWLVLCCAVRSDGFWKEAKPGLCRG